MTEQLHPGLGSGALREALAELNSISDLLHEHAVGLRYTNALRGISIGDLASCLDRTQVKLEAALSLSSPIEPESLPDFRKMAKDFLHFEGGDEVDTLAAAFAMIDGNAAQRAQPSSEIRERLQAILDSHPYEHEIAIEGYVRLQQQIAVVVGALAPSRQGAGGKMTLHLARLKARQDEAKYIRSPEESKARCDALEREIQQEEQRIEGT